MSAAPATILAFKAGRAFRREGTNFVDHSPEKGAIILQKGEDELLHFIWKNRSTGELEEDLILFPGDASFVKIPQAPGGRTYVLKFSSSNQRHFDASTNRDEEFVNNLNMVLQDPDRIPVWQTASTSQPQASTSQTGPSTRAAAPAGTTPEQLAQLRTLVQSMAGNTSQEPELSLNDILTPENVLPLFTSHPDLIPALFPHLPPDLPTPPSAEVLQQIITSPQFRGAVRNFDQALRTGMLGGLVRGLGLPEEAGTGVEAFLRAIQEQSRGEDRMETD
ncbi:adhesion regulating molecule [Gloeophyllum trabeum ATCC 11539]|uniref:Adhesion regulating molecule n=1 Tax=Gloeophyllum trabeum (strain ATCC 11539 / FP-39264 / Madison 617) TaxID=670483 RepID=S7RP81_GLOTA|nr:adhesion regulating molecule [Gloeophyllum trabeum ATCC 11539]EPQ54619.1 adhesion regulating molecule [Gloeophyllum trabeum ATCC 11539]